MNRHAKAPSAFTPGRIAALALVLAATALLALAPAAFAEKNVDRYVGSTTGSSGNAAGLHNTPRGIAVNVNGTGGAQAGDYYVADSSNHRIVQYRESGTFVRAFGLDVVSSGPDQATEIQWVTVKATAGTFKLTFNSKTTADLPFNASAAEVAAALNGLESIGGLTPTPGSVTVTGGPGDATGSSPYVITFDGGPLKGTNVAQMTAASGATPLSGGSGSGANEAKVITARSGANGYEICNALANPTDVCKAGVSGGGLGGTLSSPQGIAIHQASGDLFVTDQNNRRIQKYSATGNWLRLFGSDVVQSGGSGDVDVIPILNEKQRVALSTFGGSITGGKFKLTFNAETTAPIAWNASVAAVDAALEALSGIGPGNVLAGGSDGGPWTVEFTGPLAATNVSQLTGDSSELEGTGLRFVEASTTQQGGPGAPVLSEVCTVMWQCKAAAPAAVFAGTFGATIGHPGVDSSGNVYVPDSANNRVQKFDSSGAFLTAWGWDVIPPGKPGDLGFEALEHCPPGAASVPADCQAGSKGSGLGQLGGTSVGADPSPSRIAVDSADRLYVVDPGNKRVQTFDSDGSDPEVFFAYPDGTPGFVGAPSDIAIGPADSVFLVVPCPNNFNSDTLGDFLEACPDAPPVPSERWLRHFDSDGNLLEISLEGAGFTNPINGLAVNPANDRVYISGNSSPISHRVLTLDDDGAPGAASEIGSASDVTEGSAKLSGCVDPLGTTQLTASYRFQYSADGVNWSDAAAPVNLGSAPIDCDLPGSQLQASITGLEPNTLYRARIATQRQFANPIVPSAETTFLTDGTPPRATTRLPHGIADSFAWIAGDVDPNGVSTTYRFQWGTSTKYTEQVPLPDGSAGSGNKAKSFLHRLESLQPNTTYHYRVVAESELGTDFGEDLTFTTRPAFAGFESRGYQQVSPALKNGYDVNRNDPEGNVSGSTALGVSSPDGDAVSFGSAGAFPGAHFGAGPGEFLIYQAHRENGGWTTSHPFPRVPGVVEGTGRHEQRNVRFGGPSDALISFASGAFNTLLPDRRPGTVLLDSRDLSLRPVIDLTPAPGKEFGDQWPVVETTPDLQRQFFTSPEVLTSDPGVAPEPSLKAYEWDDGETRLVSIDVDGTPFEGGSKIGQFHSLIGQPPFTDLRTASDDGQHVFFTNFSSEVTAKIYRRSGATTTTLVSPSKRTPADPSGPKRKEFLATDDSGDRALFTSAEQLTDDANTGPSRSGQDLYLYEVSTDTLVDVSAEANTTEGARVQGVLGVSDSLDRIYYVALGEVLAGEGTVGQPNLYLWEDDGSAEGKTRFVTTLGAGEEDNYLYDAGSGSFGPSQRLSRVSADGATAIFQSAQSLTGYRTDGHSQVYVYEAGANGGQGQLSCASCRPNGTPSQGASRVPPGGYQRSAGREISRPLSFDGRRVFFNSEEALLPADVNDANDVYMWEAGRLQLISSGTAAEGDYFVGSSRSGDDVFFNTRSSLVGQDVDELVDVYDASTQGALASQNQPPPPPPCQGEACKPAAASAPAVQAPQSSAVTGSGNVKTESKPKGRARCAKGKVRRKGRCVKRAKQKQSKQKQSKRAKKRSANESRGAGK